MADGNADTWDIREKGVSIVSKLRDSERRDWAAIVFFGGGWW